MIAGDGWCLYSCSMSMMCPKPKQRDWLLLHLLFSIKLILLHSSPTLWEWQSLLCLLAHRLTLTRWILFSHYCKRVFGVEAMTRFWLSFYIPFLLSFHLSLMSRFIKTKALLTTHIFPVTEHESRCGISLTIVHTGTMFTRQWVFRKDAVLFRRTDTDNVIPVSLL